MKKKLEKKIEKIKQIKNEKFQEHNDYIINIKRMQDEQNDLVKLLQKNMGYFNKYKNSQIEIKEKNNLITQQKLDYDVMLGENDFGDVQLEEEIIELKDFIKPIQERKWEYELLK